jgi:DNA-binding SARP family transcriptional activator
VDFSVLGPLQVRIRGETVPVRRGLPRLLLTYLLLHPGEPVAASVLADRLWNGQPPEDPGNAVHRVVSYVRHTLGAAGDTPLRTTSAGYVLDVSPAVVDSTRFARLVDVCGVDATAALPLLEEALGMWRGEPLADAAGLPWATPYIAELEELHLRAQERRLTALLDLGRHVDAVPQAQALVATCPLRESLRTSLMVAVYQSGRQSEALAAAAALRRTLAEEMGIDPSPAVLALEQQILHQDPALAAPPPVAPPAVRASGPQVTAFPPRSATHGAAVGQAPADASRPVPFRRAVTSLIGREDDVAHVSAAFDEAGLLTLTGLGGTGKTRLALALLQRHSDRAVWFADLSSATDDATVATISAAATGAPTAPGTDVVDAVISHLAGRAGVLVLDTCEHVVPRICTASTDDDIDATVDAARSALATVS